MVTSSPTLMSATSVCFAIPMWNSGHFAHVAMPEEKARPQFVKYFHPRVERSTSLSLYLRAPADTRPASIAHPTQTASNWGSVAIGQTLSKTLGMSDGSESTSAAVGKPSRAIPIGQKRNTFLVQRVGDDEYCFEQKGKLLQPPAGFVLDSDTVLEVIQKLHERYPHEMPMMVMMGDAVTPGLPPMRQVRNMLECKGKALLEDEPIGYQCLKIDFSRNFHARAERTARVNLAARARADGRADAVAFLKPIEYSQRSTFAGVI